MHAVVFRFGAFQVTLDPDHFAFVEFYDVFRVFTALVFGAFFVGQAGAFAPNYAKAKTSANRIFALLDLKPAIDSYSEEGDELVSGWPCTYSGAPLLWTPWGPGEVSCMKRCPHFRGKFL